MNNIPELGPQMVEQLNSSDNSAIEAGVDQSRRHSRAFTALSKLAVVTCLALAAPIASAEAGDTYQQIPNWAGYEVDSMPSSLDYMMGDWIMPSFTCPETGVTNAEIWVGLGSGSSESDPLYQAGVRMDCNDDTGTYAAFWQEYPTVSPEQSFTFSHTVSAGDKMLAYIEPDLDGMDLVLQDYGSDLESSSPNWTDTEQIYETKPTSFGKAECITERRTIDGEGDLADLADFSTVDWSTAESGSFADACDLVANDENNIISSSGSSLSDIYRDEMYSFYEGDPLDLLTSTTGQSVSGAFENDWQASN